MTDSRIMVLGALGAVIAGAMPAAAQQPMRRPIMPVVPMAQAGPPDLIVENVREEGGAILADVRNAGPGSSAATKIALFARGGGRLEQDFPGLRAGATRTVRFERPAGASAVQVMIDPANTIVEANEANNRPAALTLGTGDVAGAGGRPAPTGRDPVAGRPPVVAGRDAGTGRPPIVIGRRPPPVDAPPVATPPIATPPVGGRRFAEADSGPIDEIVPPGINTVAKRGQVTLRPSGYRPTMQTLSPVRAPLNVSMLRGNPIQKLGGTTVDFRPFLNNPKALVNVAQRLRGLPQLADVRVDKLEAIEVRQGLVIRSFINYSLRPGACRDGVRRAQIAATGIRCATQMSPAARAAAFANPSDPRYVENPSQRAIKLNEAAVEAAKIDAETAQHVAEFRAQLADPGARAQLVAGLGAQAVQELASLDDTALAGELVNSGDTKVEQVAFVPTGDDADKPVKKKSAQPAPLEMPKPINETFDMGTHVFLTGFTLGREHEWKQRIEKSIKWCVLGCKKTYYAEVYAGFKYGFGLRFPIRFDGKVNYTRIDGKEAAIMTGNMVPFDGAPEDYAAAGLPSYQIFQGKELVAEVGAHAGFGAKLPFYPPIGVDFAVEKDFTEGLPAPLKNGQFTPPAPGKPLPIEVPFPDLDLIGGRANFGVFGAKVFPAVKVTLGSERLRFTVTDLNAGSARKYLETSGGTVDLRPDSQTSALNFRLEDPQYNLTFAVEPGIVARLFIDLGIWGNNWDWPVWFPDLKMTLPPGGVDFSCHENTTCSKAFKFQPSVTTTAFDDAVQVWAVNFEKKWLPQCIDDMCLFGVRLMRMGTMGAVKKANAEFMPNVKVDMVTWASVFGAEMKAPVITGTSFDPKPYYDAAEKSAASIVLDAQARKAQSTSNSWGILAQAIWTKQCADKTCYDEVKKLAGQMGPRAAELRKAYPEESDLKLQGMVNKEFGPKFKQAVEDSKTRAAAIAAFTQVKKGTPNPFGMTDKK